VKKKTYTEICLYCFGAKELTRDGKLLSPCPLCMGGKLKDKELAQANKKLKLYTKFTEEDDD